VAERVRGRRGCGAPSVEQLCSGKGIDMNLRPLRRNAAGSEVEQVISRLEYEAAEIKHRRVTDDQWSFYYSRGYADAIEEVAKLLRERLRTLH